MATGTPNRWSSRTVPPPGGPETQPARPRQTIAIKAGRMESEILRTAAFAGLGLRRERLGEQRVKKLLLQFVPPDLVFDARMAQLLAGDFIHGPDVAGARGAGQHLGREQDQ